MSASLQSQDARFTEEDLIEIYGCEADDPDFYREFLSTFKQVPGYLPPPPDADRILPLYMHCNISLSLPKSKEDIANIQKIVVKGETTVPLGALLHAFQQKEDGQVGASFFLRKVSNKAFDTFRGTGMVPIWEKLRCVCCGKSHTQSSKSVAAGILGLPSQGDGAQKLIGLSLLIDPFYYLCSSPKCMSQVLKAKEVTTAKSAMRMCYSCKKFEDPTNLMNTCSRCKTVFYCDSSCQVRTVTCSRKENLALLCYSLYALLESSLESSQANVRTSR